MPFVWSNFMPNLQRGGEGPCLNFAYFSMQFYNSDNPKGGAMVQWPPPKYAPGCAFTDFKNRWVLVDQACETGTVRLSYHIMPSNVFCCFVCKALPSLTTTSSQVLGPNGKKCKVFFSMAQWRIISSVIWPDAANLSIISSTLKQLYKARIWNAFGEI